MAKMRYCRFYNTWIDLRDCLEALLDVGGCVEAIDSDDERSSAESLVLVCREIVNLVDGRDDNDLTD